MAVCPKCGRVLDHLAIRSYNAILVNEDGQVKIEHLEWWKVRTEYLCPYCNAVLTDGYEDAVALLRGEEED